MKFTLHPFVQKTKECAQFSFLKPACSLQSLISKIGLRTMIMKSHKDICVKPTNGILIKFRRESEYPRSSSNFIFGHDHGRHLRRHQPRPACRFFTIPSEKIDSIDGNNHLCPFAKRPRNARILMNLRAHLKNGRIRLKHRRFRTKKQGSDTRPIRHCARSRFSESRVASIH